MVQWAGGPRGIILRLTNRGREPLSGVVLQGEIRGTRGSLQRFQIPVTPEYLPPGGEAYVSIAISQTVVKKAKEISLQAFYHKAKEGGAIRYVEDLEIRRGGGTPESGGTFKPAGLALQ